MSIDKIFFDVFNFREFHSNSLTCHIKYSDTTCRIMELQFFMIKGA